MKNYETKEIKKVQKLYSKRNKKDKGLEVEIVVCLALLLLISYALWYFWQNFHF